MIVRSLRLRLIAFALVAIAVALWTAGHVMGALFERYTERRMADTLVNEGAALIASVSPRQDGRLQIDARQLDRRFDRRASGLYWQITTSRRTYRSDSLGDKHLAGFPIATGGWADAEISGPYEEDLIAVARRIVVGGAPVIVQVAQDDEPLDRAQASFVGEMALFLTALGIALGVASWAQVELGLRPLRRVRDDLAAMQRNRARRLGSDHPREIAGLVAAINVLADAREDDVARARRRAADLAHALKTPLAALAAQSRLARAAGADRAADAIEQTLSAANAVLEAELARARAAASRVRGPGAVVRPATLIERLFAVLARTEAGMDLVFDAEIPETLTLAIDEEAFTEIFGNLLDNAARHARRIVRVTVAEEADRIGFFIDDDGPGIPPDRHDSVIRRGVRLDESGPGHGLGLSIVSDLTEATDGRLALGESPSGGLRAELSWPLSREGADA